VFRRANATSVQYMLRVIVPVPGLFNDLKCEIPVLLNSGRDLPPPIEGEAGSSAAVQYGEHHQRNPKIAVTVWRCGDADARCPCIVMLYKDQAIMGHPSILCASCCLVYIVHGMILWHG
jgi:hypothetical protein